MKKEELMKLEGMTEELASEIMKMSKDDMQGMIPQSRLNEVIAERDNAKKEHKEVLEQLDKLQKDNVDIETLKSQIEKLKTDASESQKKHDTEMYKLKVDNAVEMALNGAKSLNNKAVRALLNGLDKAEFAEDGTIKGLAEQLKGLQEADNSKFLFGSSKPAFKGATVRESGDGNDGVDTSKMNYSELSKYLAENPDVRI